MNKLDWFRVSNYDCCESWNHLDWYCAINARLRCESWMDTGSDLAIVFSFLVEDEKLAADPLNARWDVVIQSLHQAPLRARDKELFIARETTSEEIAVVVPMTLSRLGALCNELIEPLQKHERRVLLGRMDDDALSTQFDKSIEEQYLAMGFGADQMGNEAYAVVDLSMPDEFLTMQFMKFVRKQRNLLGIEALEKPPLDTHFKRWHKHKILGYFDLYLWQKVTKSTLTDNQIGLLLFPEEYEISLEDKIRKVVAPLAKRIFRSGAAKALASKEWFSS